MKVFRLQNEEQTSLKQESGWFDSDEYTSREIMSIPDPDGGKGNEPTSIPSPFARMDLTNTAFRYVNELGKKAGLMFKRIVSDTIDLMEIFFYQDLYKEDFRIIEWDRQSEIEKLLKSNNKEHIRLGDTLNMYLNNKDDASSFNFDIFQKFYLIKYKFKVIGSSSPLTLFFTTANNLDWTGITFPDGHIAFDKTPDYQYPLNKRNEEFQLWIYSMRQNYPHFRAHFREVSTYMDICLNDLLKDNPALYTRIQNLTPNDYSVTLYDKIGSGILLVNRLPLLKARKLFDDVQSDFMIDSVKYTGNPKPLVLQHEHKGVTSSGKPMIYYTSAYDEKNEIPFYDERTLDQRTLPGLTNIRYPYLTVSDFLEPFLIRTIYPVNKESFFDGNHKKGSYKEEKGFILPIKKRYFEYFNVDDLKKKISGKPVFEMESLSSGTTTAILRIPVKGGEFIEFKREYVKSAESDTREPDLSRNEGFIIDNQFGLGIFPCLRFEADEDPHYRIALVDRDISPSTITNFYTLAFYNQENVNKAIKTTDIKKRNIKSPQDVETNYYVFNSNFDFLSISVNSRTNGIIIPTFARPQRTRKFTFAIDFGTTNTHIEYSSDTGRNYQPFDIRDHEIQIVKLHSREARIPGEIRQTFDHDFIPEIIETDGQYSYPMRTALSVSKNANYQTSMFALADVNIPFTYEREVQKHYNSCITNLKWSGQSSDNSKQVELYLENLFLIIRNKVILNGGKLDDTKIVWFYPASMLEHRYNNFRLIWESLYRKYIGSNLNNLLTMSESIAPYYYYSSSKGARRNVVSVDIGGGSTDVVIIEETMPTLLTSFRYAADAVFGDGYGFDSDTNGFVCDFKDKINKSLRDNELFDLCKILESIESQKRSADIIAFFFSLATNRDIRSKNIKIHFADMLSDNGKYKIVFILFYVSVMYHIAGIMKAKNMAMPRYITFSGTGSKILRILSPENRVIEEFTLLIFEKIFGTVYGPDGLTIIRNEENPKEATCKGGLYNPVNQHYDSIDKIKATLIGFDRNTFADKTTRYTNFSDNNLNSIVEETRRFIEFAFSLNDEFPFHKKFGAELKNLNEIKELSNRDIIQHLQDGFDKKQKELALTGTDQPIEETLFFYPLIGIINSLVRHIFNKS